MLYKSIYNLLYSVASGLAYDVEFAHGRASDINIFSTNNKSVLIWLTPMKSTGTFQAQGNRLFRNWRIELGFYQSDKVDSDNDETLQILELSDKIATDYIISLNNTIPTLSGIQDDIEVEGLSTLPFIKITSHILTGQLITFNITLPDNFDFC